MFQPSKTLTAWSLLMASGDPESQRAAQIIEQACAHELLHAFLNGEIGPVTQVSAPKVEPKPEPKLEPAPTPQPEPIPPKRREKPLFAPEGGGQSVAELGKQPLPVQYYKSEPVKVNGILIGKLVDKLEPNPTAFFKQCGLKNGKGFLRGVLWSPDMFTASGEWLIEIFGEQVRA